MIDWVYSTFIVVVLFVFLVTAIGMTIKNANQEAIKAGLVQDNEGHWVRSELEKEEHNE